MNRKFPKKILSALQKAMVIGIKAGKGPHRIIAVWAVVADGRVFIRSWSLKKKSWLTTFRREPVGELHVSNRTIRIRSVFTRSESLKDKVSAAYRNKYHTPASLRYVKDLSHRKSRNTTTELVPLGR